MFTPLNFRSSIKNHTTNDEMMYIKAIGNYHIDAMKLDRITLLNRYIGSLKLRSDWNGIDNHKVMDYAINELTTEMAKKVGDSYANS